MPSVISHAAVAVAAGIAFAPRGVIANFWPLSIVCSVLPDADVIGFSFGIPYHHFLGHRGFFHSPLFGLLVGLALATLLCRDAGIFSRWWLFYFIFFSLIGASHGILDAFTNGGLGIALLSPFDTARYFFPWRPIVVSPIGIEGFLGRWGWAVIKSELVWVWLPSSVVVAAATVVRVWAGRH